MLLLALSCRPAAAAAMDDEQRYLFDSRGVFTIPGALSLSHVDELNQVLEHAEGSDTCTVSWNESGLDGKRLSSSEIHTTQPFVQDALEAWHKKVSQATSAKKAGNGGTTASSKKGDGDGDTIDLSTQISTRAATERANKNKTDKNAKTKGKDKRKSEPLVKNPKRRKGTRWRAAEKKVYAALDSAGYSTQDAMKAVNDLIANGQERTIDAITSMLRREQRENPIHTTPNLSSSGSSVTSSASAMSSASASTTSDTSTAKQTQANDDANAMTAASMRAVAAQRVADATVRIFTTHTVMLWYDEFVDRNVYDKSIIVDTNTVLL